jgi:UDP-N-acetylmuramoyl-tripeptide--D-alanyl-D-alanine ligase
MQQFFKHIVVSLLTWEARMVIHRNRPFIIAVTGSVGKTTTKDAIAAVLSGTGKTTVRKSEKSFNSEIGLPLTILGLSNAWRNPFLWLMRIMQGLFIVLSPGRYPEVLVLEIGADHPGDIARVGKWLKPNVAVVTRLPDRPVHVEFFSSPEEVKKEKSELVKALRPDGVYIANADDPAVLALSSLTTAQMITYGFSADAQLKGSNPSVLYEERDGLRLPTGMTFILEWGERPVEVALRGTLGVQSCSAVLAACAVGAARGLTADDMIKAVENIALPPGRMRMIEGVGNTTIIDDSYNSSPVAAEAALEALRFLEANHKVAVLGDMLELGEYSQEEHWKIGRIAGGFVDLLVVVGERARMIAEAAKTAGLPEGKIRTFMNSEEAGHWVAQAIKPGDLILVKGSQGSGANMIRMERAVKVLMAHPDQASSLLVRQEPEWLAQYE